MGSVAHQRDRNLAAVPAEPVNEIENAGQGGSGAERALGGELDGGPVRERVGEGDTELDDVGASLGQRRDEALGGSEVRVAGAEVDDQ